ncbi:hypothetical protein L1887_57007 [Cichorium endivia]|nr:hypothetical protein L1887_57007 [Cichorium endivia]
MQGVVKKDFGSEGCHTSVWFGGGNRDVVLAMVLKVRCFPTFRSHGPSTDTFFFWAGPSTMPSIRNICRDCAHLVSKVGVYPTGVQGSQHGSVSTVPMGTDGVYTCTFTIAE